MGLILVAFLASLEAQSCPANLVPMPVTVTVRERSVQEPVRGLTAQDFLLRGKTVVSVASGLPADIVILIEDRGRGGLLAGAADLLVKSLLPEDQVAVVTYGVSTKKQLAFTRDPNAIRLAIEKGADGTHLQIARPLYGVVDAYKLFGKASPARQRAIFMIGDNIDSGSQIRIEQLAANLIEERISLDLAIDPAPSRKIPRLNVPPPTVGNDSPAMRPALVGQQSVSLLAEASGGTSDAYVRAEFFSEMRERLKQRVTLTYCVEKKHASKVPQVELSDAAKQKWPNAELRSPGVPGR
ncbi:MAG: hypothetical protein NTW74_20865 [Acidobacteria bacterium]|nr:hypothetical protein [Acidobacteriota bacterium]